MFSQRKLRFTQSGKDSAPGPSQPKSIEYPEQDDTQMTGTHVSGESEDDVDPLQKSGSVVEIRGKGKEVRRRARTPSPSNEETYFRILMGEILEGIRRQEEWTGQAAEEIGMRLEDLSEEQKKTWFAMATIQEEAAKSGTIARSHIQRWTADLEKLSSDLHAHQITRELELKAEQKRQNEELIATVKKQQEQQQEQQRIIEELRRTQQAWTEYVDKTLPAKVYATITEAQKGNPSAGDIEQRIRQLIHENQPAPVVTTPMLTEADANELIAAALAKQALENEKALQHAIEEATRRTREESAGPSREEIQRMIEQARRRRQSIIPPGTGSSGIGQTPSGQPIIVKVDMPDRLRHRPATEPWLYAGEFSENLRAWLLACEDFFNWNPSEWEEETDCIKYAIGRIKEKTKAHDFGISYRRSMEGLDGSPLRPLFKKWGKFKTEIQERFEPKEGAMLAKIEMDNLKYKGDISSYIDKIQSLNFRVEMKGVALRALIQTAIPPEARIQLLYAPPTNNDDDWMELVV